MPTQVIYLMGVSGSGKTTIGERLSAATGIPFFDGDDFHPPANVAKMRAGQPLDDADRAGWLAAIHAFVEKKLASGSVIIACSALKEKYRAALRQNFAERVFWIVLLGDFDLLLARMQARTDHFMPPALLKSQLETLEIPKYGLHLDVSASENTLIQTILEKIKQQNSAMNNQFGVFGLGVMGRSIARNLANKGVQLSIFNQHVAGKEENIARNLQAAHPELATAAPFDDLAAFVASLAQPRKILLMVNAGAATDAVIRAISPLLAKGDILIDGGNSHYRDTKNRAKMLAERGVFWLGCGISGGESGALHGPSIMPGGDLKSFKKVQKILESVAALDHKGKNCCAYIGPDGAGHFVKMVHNGIEYAEMQLLSEAYWLLRRGLGLSPDAISAVFSEWSKTELSSYLLEISAKILQKKEGEKYLIDLILDQAGNKGTGSWATVAAAELGVAATMLSAALFARYISAQKSERMYHGALLRAPNEAELRGANEAELRGTNVESIKKAYQFARMINHHQGFELMQTASIAHDWGLNLAEIARIWTNGCIIRSKLMEKLVAHFKKETSILRVPFFQKELAADQKHLVKTVNAANVSALAVPCLSEALQYFNGISAAESPANLLQAQRDFFGAHTYQRTDDTTGQYFHTIWEN
jgi:6-phosphogluconate dehydrogenase